MLITLLIFVVVLGVLVFVHELGHFLVAKRSGAAVEEFGFGYPPRMFGIRKGGTLYSLNWIPLGGFVRIRGENGQEANDPQSFTNLRIHKRAAVLAAGVAMNILLAIVLMGFVFTIGAPSAIDETLPAGATVRNQHIQIVSVEKGTPAEKVGIADGDILESINGQSVATIEGVQELNAASEGKEQQLVIQRGHDHLTFAITPVLDAELGKAVWGVGLLEAGTVSFPWYRALWLGAKGAIELLWQIVVAFVQLVKNLVVHQEVPSDVAGPIGIAALTGHFVNLGFVYLVQFTALLSLNLAVINILPIPALDGGRILFLAIEAVRRKRINARVESMIHNVGFVVLMGLVVLVSIRDVSRFGGQIRHFFGQLFGG